MQFNSSLDGFEPKFLVILLHELGFQWLRNFLFVQFHIKGQRKMFVL